MQGIVPASKGFDAVELTRFCEDLRLVNQFSWLLLIASFSAAPKTKRSFTISFIAGLKNCQPLPPFLRI